MNENKSFLKELSIKNYRGFFEEETLFFAIPNGKVGSGLTVIAGPNNAGKTSVIEALTLNVTSKIPATERHGDISPIITIKTTNGISKFSNIDNGSQVSNIENTEHIAQGFFEIISSRRDWDSYSDNLYDIKQISTLEGRISRQNNNNIQLGSVLKGINQDKNKTKKEEFTALIKIFIPNFNTWTVDTDDNQRDYIKYVTNNNTSHKTNLLGNGVISIFRICAHLLLEDESKVLIIDEPEISLHPSAQKLLAKSLSEKSKNRQIIVCTHSPYFINWDDLSNDAAFIRLNKYDDKKCTVHTLKKTLVEKLYKLNTYKNPHLLDIASKEIMFSSKLLFVEGQEDVGLIRNWARKSGTDINFEIFGYGTKGWENFREFLEISKSLGIQKIGALYDKGTENDTIDKDGKNISLNQDFKECINLFKPYKILQLPTTDLRDKPKKLGIFNKEGELKESTHDEKINAELFRKIIKDYIEYFQE